MDRLAIAFIIFKIIIGKKIIFEVINFETVKANFSTITVLIN